MIRTQQASGSVASSSLYGYEQLLAQSDVISLHLPLSPETLYLLKRTNDFTDENEVLLLSTQVEGS